MSHSAVLAFGSLDGSTIDPYEACWKPSYLLKVSEADRNDYRKLLGAHERTAEYRGGGNL